MWKKQGAFPKTFPMSFSSGENNRAGGYTFFRESGFDFRAGFIYLRLRDFSLPCFFRLPSRAHTTVKLCFFPSLPSPAAFLLVKTMRRWRFYETRTFTCNRLIIMGLSYLVKEWRIFSCIMCVYARVRERRPAASRGIRKRWCSIREKSGHDGEALPAILSRRFRPSRCKITVFLCRAHGKNVYLQMKLKIEIKTKK